jgi:hypothetical protein
MQVLSHRLSQSLMDLIDRPLVNVRKLKQDIRGGEV